MRRVTAKFGLYCDEFKIHEADVLAYISPSRVDVVSVTIPWKLPGGMTTYLDAIEMLTVSTLTELKDYLRGAFGAQDAVEPWDMPDGAA